MAAATDNAGTRPRPADRVCERCGKAEALALGDRVLCRDCYFACNSCCLEFGGDDLWKEVRP
jgi:hypothetical protein